MDHCIHVHQTKAQLGPKLCSFCSIFFVKIREFRRARSVFGCPHDPSCTLLLGKLFGWFFHLLAPTWKLLVWFLQGSFLKIVYKAKMTRELMEWWKSAHKANKLSNVTKKGIFQVQLPINAFKNLNEETKKKIERKNGEKGKDGDIKSTNIRGVRNQIQLKIRIRANWTELLTRPERAFTPAWSVCYILNTLEQVISWSSIDKHYEWDKTGSDFIQSFISVRSLAEWFLNTSFIIPSQPHFGFIVTSCDNCRIE